MLIIAIIKEYFNEDLKEPRLVLKNIVLVYIQNIHFSKQKMKLTKYELLTIYNLLLDDTIKSMLVGNSVLPRTFLYSLGLGVKVI